MGGQTHPERLRLSGGRQSYQEEGLKVRHVKVESPAGVKSGVETTSRRKLCIVNPWVHFSPGGCLVPRLRNGTDRPRSCSLLTLEYEKYLIVE